MSECPVCRQELTDCFANKDGRCTILQRTSFRYECPFYKHKDSVSMEKIERDIRLYKGGRR